MQVLGSTRIRAVETGDLEATRRWRNDPKVWGPALGRRFPITEPGERGWFDHLGSGAFPTQVVWAVADENDSVLGLVRLDDIHWIHRTAMFGIWIGPEHWGNGHAGRATRLVCDHALDSLGLRQLRLQVVAGNDAARSVYLANGFVDEGVLRDAVLLDGRYHDLLQMVLPGPTSLHPQA
ncbi:MAG: GNAT family protein [Ilumatobacteraceae bacterium]